MSDRPDLRVVDEADGRAAAIGLGPEAGYDDWLRIGDGLAAEHGSTTWAAADWLAWGSARWAGERVSAAADRLGISPGKIRNYVLVSETYPIFARRKSLSFSHHLEAVRLPDEDRERLLDAAEAECWTRAQMREAVHEARRADRLRTRPDPEEARDAAARYRDRLDAERRVIVGDIKRMTRITAEIAGSDEIRALHGNARRGLARDLRRAGAIVAERVRNHRADTAAALARIEDKETDLTECAVAALADEIDLILRAAEDRIAAAARAGMPEQQRHALAASLEAILGARMEAANRTIAEAIRPALDRLSGGAA